MKLCVECRYAVNPTGRTASYEWDCTHPSSFRVHPPSPVTGVAKPPEAMACAAVRTMDPRHYCGAEGQFWEARQGDT